MDNQMIDALVDELLPELLPDIVNDFAALIGMPKTLTLISHCGGLDMVMPTGELDSIDAQRLTAVLGAETAKKLMQQYGGDHLYIPRCHAAMTQLRQQQFCEVIANAVAGGMSQRAAIRQYAPQYGYSERWAYNAISAMRESTQMNLF